MCDAHMRAMRVTHSVQYTSGVDILVNGGIPKHISHVYFNSNENIFTELGERATRKPHSYLPLYSLLNSLLNSESSVVCRKTMQFYLEIL